MPISHHHHSPEVGGGFRDLQDWLLQIPTASKIIWSVDIALVIVYLLFFIKNGYLKNKPWTYFQLLCMIVFTGSLAVGTVLENMYLHIYYIAYFNEKHHEQSSHYSFHMSPWWLIARYDKTPALAVLVCLSLVVFPLLQLYFLNFISLTSNYIFSKINNHKKILFSLSNFFDIACKYSFQLFLHFIVYVNLTDQLKKNLKKRDGDKFKHYIDMDCKMGIHKGCYILTILTLVLVLFSIYVKYYRIYWYRNNDGGKKDIVDIYINEEGDVDIENFEGFEQFEDLEDPDNIKTNKNDNNKNKKYLFNFILFCVLVGCCVCFIQLLVARHTIFEILAVDDTGMFNTVFVDGTRYYNVFTLVRDFLDDIYVIRNMTYFLAGMYYLVILIIPFFQFILLIIIFFCDLCKSGCCCSCLTTTFKNRVTKIAWFLTLYNCIDVFIVVLIIQHIYDPNIIDYVVHNTWFIKDYVNVCIESGWFTKAECESLGVKLILHDGFWYLAILWTLLTCAAIGIIFIKPKFFGDNKNKNKFANIIYPEPPEDDLIIQRAYARPADSMLAATAAMDSYSHMSIDDTNEIDADGFSLKSVRKDSKRE